MAAAMPSDLDLDLLALSSGVVQFAVETFRFVLIVSLVCMCSCSERQKQWEPHPGGAVRAGDGWGGGSQRGEGAGGLTPQANAVLQGH
jgi:hypothetical protein